MSTDPFAAVEQAAKRQALEELGAKAVSAARSRLVLGKDAPSAFFATLALRLIPEPRWDIETAAVDGKRLAYNPEWFAGLSLDEAIGVTAHEVMHVANRHHSRRQHRDATNWNVAADLAVNPLLREVGFTLPRGALFAGEGKYRELPAGLGAEEYYELLRKPAQDNPHDSSGEDGSGSDPGGCGGVAPPGDGSQAAQKESEAEWEVAVAQAQQVAKQRGKLPAGLARTVDEILQSKVNWRDVLREFVSRNARNDYAFSPPNRRFIHLGLYLPGVRSEELGEVVLAVDTSGSIGADVLQTFANEAQGVLDSYECNLHIVYHDSQVQHTQTWQPSDGPLKLEPRGGGGTSHVPVFEHIETVGLSPACLICLTDGYTQYPSRGPDYPVLWAVIGSSSAKVPFGQLVAVAS